MGCGQGCLKAILVGVNVVFFLAGAAVLGIGLWVRLDKNIGNIATANGLGDFVQPLYISAYVLIAFGAFTFVIGFCGCCGALKESQCLLGIYIAFVVGILAAEIAGGVVVYVKKDSIIGAVEDVALDYLKNDYGKPGNNNTDNAWNLAMQYLKCCGVNGTGVENFDNSYYKNLTKKAAPDACCKRTDDGKSFKDLVQCRTNSNDDTYINRIGCKDALENLFMKYSKIILGVAAGVAGFELLVAIMAICFCCTIGKDD